MSNVENFPEREIPDPLVGPFEEYRVIVDGRVIPGLTGRHHGDETSLIVDRRFSTSVPRNRAYDIAWLIAQAIAIAQGYPHLGAETKDRPFAPMGMEISLPSDES